MSMRMSMSMSMSMSVSMSMSKSMSMSMRMSMSMGMSMIIRLSETNACKKLAQGLRAARSSRAILYEKIVLREACASKLLARGQAA